MYGIISICFHRYSCSVMNDSERRTTKSHRTSLSSTLDRICNTRVKAATDHLVNGNVLKGFGE